jgi:hypothetical protein
MVILFIMEILLNVFKILDNDFQEIIDVTQLQIIMEKVVNYDYADDATAESNNVPIVECKTRFKF